MNLPESEGPMRAWLRSRAVVAAHVGTRVYFGVPEQDRPELPFLVFYRVGGLPDVFAQDHPDYIIEAWGENKHQASTVAKDVAATILSSQSEPPVVVDGVKVLMGDVNLGPVPSAGQAWAKRYRIDASFHMRLA